MPLVYKTTPMGKAMLIEPDDEMDDKEQDEALASYQRVMERITQKKEGE